MSKESRRELIKRARRHHEASEFVEAQQIFRRILEADSTDAHAWYLTGVTSLALGNNEQAIGDFQQAIKNGPSYAHAFNHLGIALAREGRHADAVQSFREAIRLMPYLGKAHYNLAMAEIQQGDLDRALVALHAAGRLMPDWANVPATLGQVCASREDFSGAEAYYRQALTFAPGDANLHQSLGWALARQWKLDEAIGSLRRALEIQPDHAEAHNSLGHALLCLGRAEEAATNFRLAIQHQPTFAKAHSNLLMCLHYLPNPDLRSLFAEHCRWAKQQTASISRFSHELRSSTSPSGRLRIGYVSGDFIENHPIAHLVEPIFAAHDRTRFHVFAYTDVRREDTGTHRIRSLTEEWRPISGWTDDEVARQIRKDEIDILVDLAGHTKGNRLRVFAYKPARIQVTYFGYPDTTGLREMDYRLTDAFADPPGSKTEGYYAEKLIRLPGMAWCYRAPLPCPDVGPLPACAAGHVTFGCFNNTPKITGEAIDLWSQILHAVQNSRIKILANYDGRGNSHITDAFAHHGIDRARITLLPRERHEKYLQLHQTVDIGLDPFPYNGGVTTCDALWMGVPVITLLGSTYVSRQGALLLTNLGLPELIATTPQAYVEIAVRLARDIVMTEDLRLGLRERMKNSVILDGTTCARNLEDAFCDMWRSHEQAPVLPLQK